MRNAWVVCQAEGGAEDGSPKLNTIPNLPVLPSSAPLPL